MISPQRAGILPRKDAMIGRDKDQRRNELGRLKEHRDANGKVATYAYDTSGRPVTEVHGAPCMTIARTY